MIQFAFSNDYIYELPEGHKFPMEKYQLVHDQLLYQGLMDPHQVHDPGLIDEELILKCHHPNYWQEVKNGNMDPKKWRKVGLPWSRKAVKRALNSVAGTWQATLWALEEGAGANLAGGTHHAYADRGEGFSVLNDMAISALNFLDRGLGKKLMFVDLDVHQGNGNAFIFQGDERVFTFSMHGANNYPFKKERSDLDIALADGCDGSVYLHHLKNNLPQLLDRFKPDLVYYQAGVDILAQDRLGKLAVSLEACAERDHFVFRQLYQRSIPVVCVMGGGYAQELKDVVNAHFATFRELLEIYS